MLHTFSKITNLIQKKKKKNLMMFYFSTHRGSPSLIRFNIISLGFSYMDVYLGTVVKFDI